MNFFRKRFSLLIEAFNKLDSIRDLITVEVFASIFGTSKRVSSYWLEVARRQGFLDKKYEISCPHCRKIVDSVNYKHELQKVYQCTEQNCLELGPFKALENMLAIYQYKTKSV